MTFPQPNLPGAELDAFDLDDLDAFLTSDRVAADCMPLSELDGFLTAIAIGPEPIMPSEWLPVIWGATEPVFESDEELRIVVGTIFMRHEAILRDIEQEPDAYEPLLKEGPDGELTAADWAAGFMNGAALRKDAWRPLLQVEEGAELLAPIMAFLNDEDGKPLPEVEPDELADVHAAAIELIAPSVRLMHRFWRVYRRLPRSVRRTGRNEPCPCGSGRKYKRCCGAR